MPNELPESLPTRREARLRELRSNILLLLEHETQLLAMSEEEYERLSKLFNYNWQPGF